MMEKAAKSDIRVMKTNRGIKEAILKLVLKKPFREITITDIAKEALMNRKTFYTHFDTIEDAFIYIEQDFVKEINDQFEKLDPYDVTGAIKVYYNFLNTDDKSIQKLLFGDDYATFQRRFSNDVMTSDFFMKFCKNKEYKELVSGFLESVTGIYLRWKKEKKHIVSLDELAEKTAALLVDGLSIFSAGKGKTVDL